MFITTFYSYKGGVGRSLALANVAAELSNRGKSVLIADFDLEAPGAASFDFSEGQARNIGGPGIIDFIGSWANSHVSPDVREFIYKTREESDNRGPIWVMPAGRVDKAYSTRLQNIDFADLYENQDGFLLFEDLKAQWQEVLNVDYVLLDSRTGHTDIGGVCTRQLPNLVVFVFWPNAQNLSGLSLILSDLKEEESESGRQISKLFVPSNLPTLDDEDNQLATLLDKFRSDLGYNLADESRLYNYPSLDLLEQKLFILHRPKSRLAKEYRELADAVQKKNDADEYGVQLYLRGIIAGSEARTGSLTRPGFPFRIPIAEREKITRLYEKNWNSPEVIRNLATINVGDADFAKATMLIQRLIGSGSDSLTDHLMLAEWSLYTKGASDIDAIINRLLTDPDASQRHVLAALNLVSKATPDLSPSDADDLASQPAVSRLTIEQIANICSLSQEDDVKTRLAANFARVVIHSTSFFENPDLNDSVATDLSLTLIGAGMFDEAVDLLSNTPMEQDQECYRRRMFNLAMAIWGSGKESPDIFFQNLLESHAVSLPSTLSANYYQCLALAAAKVGSSNQASEFLEMAYENVEKSASSFSCWSYRSRNTKLFQRELHELKMSFTSGILEPPVLAQRPLSLIQSPS